MMLFFPPVSELHKKNKRFKMGRPKTKKRGAKAVIPKLLLIHRLFKVHVHISMFVTVLILQRIPTFVTSIFASLDNKILSETEL